VALHLVSSIVFTVLMLNQAPMVDSLVQVKWNYEPAGRRDPFTPLIGLELGGGKTGHLSPENLKLIGVLWGDKGYYALVKDGLDNGYILKRGDRVAGGHVNEINRQAIIFEIVHAGVVTKYELRLQEEKK
jgi:hypothetical protein